MEKAAVPWKCGSCHCVYPSNTSLCAVPASTPAPDIKQLNLQAARRRAQHKAIHTDKVDYWNAYNWLDAVCCHHSKQRQSESWTSLCSTLDDPRNQSYCWRILGAMLHPQILRSPALSITVVQHISATKLTDLLADTSCWPRLYLWSHQGTGVKPHYASFLHGIMDETHALCNATFTLGELLAVLPIRKRCFAPGSNGITCQMHRNLNSLRLPHLLEAYNKIWCFNVSPPVWKEVIVAPVFQKGKPAS